MDVNQQVAKATEIQSGFDRLFKEKRGIDIPIEWDIVPIIELCSKLTAEYDSSHDLQHHIDVYQNAIAILSKMIADRSISMIMFEYFLKFATYACLLHDTIDHKYPNNLESKIKMVDDFLAQNLGMYARDVKWVINNISFSKEVKQGYPSHPNALLLALRDIVSDADKLEAIGNKGIERCRQYTIASNPDLPEDEITKLVVKHCHEKLLKLKDSYIRFDYAKEIAEPLHNEIVTFVAQAQ